MSHSYRLSRTCWMTHYLPFQNWRAGGAVLCAQFVEEMCMSHAYLVEIDHSIVGMIVLEAEGYRFYATKPALSSLHSHLFDTREQAHYVILDRHGRSNETKSSLTPLCILQPGRFETSEIIANELADLQSTKPNSEVLLSHYQNVGLPAVVAALNVIAEAGQSANAQEAGHAEDAMPEFLRSVSAAA